MLSYKAEVVKGHLSHSPKKSKELQVITGFSDVEIREAVRELRFQRVKVCSGSKGFWLWNEKDDSWNHTKNDIKSRAMKLYALYKAMEEAPLPGQVEL